MKNFRVKLRRQLLCLKKQLSKIYAFLLCLQECIICKDCLHGVLPICENCIKTSIQEALRYRIENPGKYCQICGRFLISEKELCTNCRSNRQEAEKETENNSCDRIFAIYPYQDKIGKALIAWKNLNKRNFAEFFADVVFKFIQAQTELQNIRIVPVPPRPKKLKTKGWDQIEDLAIYLEIKYNVKIFRTLTRDDGVAQKTLSLKKRQTNLKGKIHLKKDSSKIPKTLIILDDVMTTGATLSDCAKTLKEAGCNKVYGLCLFFD